MAISILNTVTGSDTGPAPYDLTLSVPATTAASTLIVIITSSSVITRIDDSTGTNTFTEVTGATCGLFPSSGVFSIWYRDNVPAGITSVTIISSSPNYASYIEASGINHITPLETSNSKVSVFDPTPVTVVTGNSLSTAYTDALFIGGGRNVQNSDTWGTANNGWTKVNTLNGLGQAHVYKIGSGSQQVSINKTSSNNRYCIGTASFNPTATTYTLDLDDSITVPDNTTENDTEIVKSDTFSLSDFIDLILSTNSHFRSLVDSLVVADSISAVLASFRTFQDSVLVEDVITFIKDSQFSLSDIIRVQDWLGIKKDSDPWGS